MALSQAFSLSSLTFLSQRPSISSRKLTILPKLPLRTVRNSFPVLACSAPKSAPATEEDILDAIAESDGGSLPGVRTYENDLARLTLVGAVDFEQALTAAASDGGEAAEEHIASGAPTMVVETVFPGPSDEHSTISTRLFLPARKVKEKAKKLKSSLKRDILSTTTSRNILAMTFRQVILEQLWNFELVLFKPGTVRDMKELDDPREVPASFALSSLDKKLISLLGEVVCRAALESTEKYFLHQSLGRKSNIFSRWFHKFESIALADSSVTIYKLYEDEVVATAKSLLENFNSKKGNYKALQTNSKYSWWTLSTYSKLEKIGGPDFSTWISEYVPAYRLQIDADRLPNVTFEGWKKSADNRWEVILTHSQMVALANILDMYYEDTNTLPSKQLSCGAVAKPTNLSTDKRSALLFKLVSVTLASGFVLVMISIFGQLYLPYLHSGRKYPGENHTLQSYEVDSMPHQAMESTKLEAFCISIVKRIKDAFGWPGDIMTEKSVGAWIGELPVWLKRHGEDDSSCGESPSGPPLVKDNDEESKTSIQDIASYEVVLSAEGKIVGFQPTSRVAVNQWAANPLAKELYGGRKLSPGFIEPVVKMSRPSDPVVIELLMSSNPDSSFALARPAK
ncbi:Cysteine--tRNA ligase [Actinidia chinensis var. chinensis]|uniref:Cysteine--tRNA ligase n=1 Tax=Actinidia chinensis var. chinensis TaxID=1590841 RepID=A0A2R6PXX9_ACTCC|nr:Cysteine--tRNA ligase [Actinidia chinensis var. chinensis]